MAGDNTQKGKDVGKLVVSIDDLLELLNDLLEERGSEWWSGFYSDPDRQCPFFTNDPNEDLVELVEQRKILPPAKVLELGCGNGRNSNYLAAQGFAVDAVDFSESAINIARENADKLDLSVSYRCSSIFDLDFSDKSYDLVYDSGCFHHIAPHRRPSFLSILVQTLRRGGMFAMTCFAPGGGSDYSDLDVYKNRSLGGGLSFTRESIDAIFSGQFHNISIRKMQELPEDAGKFGKSFLWIVRMQMK